MDNQHRKIAGYRELDEMEIDLDERWKAIARTDLQKGFMSLVRAVAQPESF